MKKLITLVFGMCIVLASLGIATAHPNDGLEGLLIGGAGGAVVGHIVTGTPEGIIVGSLLGSTIGMLIDAGNDRHGVVLIRDRYRHHERWPGKYYRSRGPWPHRGDRHFYGRDRHNPRWDRHRDRYLR